MDKATGHATGREATQHTVLIVDDTPQNLTVLGEPLQPECRVRAATRFADPEPRSDR